MQTETADRQPIEHIRPNQAVGKSASGEEEASLSLWGIVVGTVKNTLVKFPSEMVWAYLTLPYGSKSKMKKCINVLLVTALVHTHRAWVVCQEAQDSMFVYRHLAKHFPQVAWIKKNTPSVQQFQREAQK